MLNAKTLFSTNSPKSFAIFAGDIHVIKSKKQSKKMREKIKKIQNKNKNKNKKDTNIANKTFESGGSIGFITQLGWRVVAVSCPTVPHHKIT